MKNLVRKQLTAVMGMVLLSAEMALGAGTSSAQFLKLGAGARAAGMGDAFCSIADDVNAIYWNPAGLAQVKDVEISGMHNSYLQETNYQYLAGVLPFEKSSLGAFIQKLDFGSIDRYTAANVKDGSFEAGSMAVGIGLGVKMSENAMFGFTTKYVSESIENVKATTFAGDFGAMVKKGNYTFGAAVQHLGPGLKMVKDSYSLPLTFRAGASGRFMNERLLGAIEVSKPNDDDASLHLGTEYKLGDLVLLRGGYRATPGNAINVDGITGINVGLGMKLNRFNFDYSVSPFGDLGMAHRISLLVKFSKN